MLVGQFNLMLVGLFNPGVWEGVQTFFQAAVMSFSLSCALEMAVCEGFRGEGLGF